MGLKAWLPGLRAALAMPVGGLLLAGAFPNWNLWPLALVGLLPLFWALHTQEPRRAAVLGWLFGMGLGLGLRYWLMVVMTTYGEVPWPLALLGLLLLEAYLALYPALFAGLAALFRRRGWNPLWTAPFIWAGLEWLRGQALTGFPWLPLANGLTAIPPLLQSAEFWGATGVSALVVLVNALLFKALWPEGAARPRLLAGLAALLLLAGGWGWGAARMAQVQAACQEAPQLWVTVVQANIPLERLWHRVWRPQIIQKHMELTRQAAAQVPERPWLVVWPESAAPFYFMYEPADSQPILDLARELKADLTLGSQGLVRLGPPLVASNRAWMVGPDGRPEGYYDKVHLVPFGEYVPLGKVFFFVRAVAALGLDFQPGAKGGTLNGGGVVLGPLICYESIFPELARAQRLAGAQLLVNQTNDSWYGRTGAAYQHQSHLVLRAIENRLAVARAANTGVSGFVLPDGRVTDATGLFVEAQATRRLPLLDMPTLYVRLGDVLGPSSLGLCLAAWAWALWRGRQARRALASGAGPDQSP